jgi:hypothetical protein
MIITENGEIQQHCGLHPLQHKMKTLDQCMKRRKEIEIGRSVSVLEVVND